MQINQKNFTLGALLLFRISSLDCMEVENIDKKNYGIQFPLHYQVSFAKKSEIQNLLVQQKNTINQLDNVGQTPLFKAVLFGNKKVVSLLLKNHAKVNIFDAQGATPLDYALSCGNQKIIKMLIKKQKESIFSHDKGWTAMHTAATFDTSGALLQNMLNHGSDPLSLALVRTYAPDEWVDEMVEQWFKNLDYAKEILELEYNKQKDRFCTLASDLQQEQKKKLQKSLQESLELYEQKKKDPFLTPQENRILEQNRQEAVEQEELKSRDIEQEQIKAEDTFARCLYRLEQQKKNDIFQCSLVLYRFLCSFNVSLEWPEVKRDLEGEGDLEELYTVEQFCKKVEEILSVKTNFFDESPSLDWFAISNWADRLLNLLNKRDDLPEIIDVDWQEVREWLKENKWEFVRAGLLDNTTISWNKLLSWKCVVAKYIDDVQRWDLPCTSYKINDRLRQQWSKFLAEVILKQNLDRYFKLPGNSWSIQKLKFWINKINIATRHSASEEFLVVPCIDFENNFILEMVKFLRMVIGNRLVSGVLILPQKSNRSLSTWIEEVLHNFVMSTQSPKGCSKKNHQNSQRFVTVPSDYQQGVSDEMWLEGLKTQKENLFLNGFLLADEINKKKIHQALELLKQDCQAYDSIMLVVKDSFSGSLVNESTRAILKDVSDDFQVKEGVINDEFGHRLKTNRLIVTASISIIYKWFDFLQSCINKNENLVQKLKHEFAEYMNKKILQDEVVQLIQQDIPLKKKLTFSDIILDVFTKTYIDINPLSTKLNAQDWADKICYALKEKIGLDLTYLIYYLLVEDGYQLRVNGVTEDSFVNWSSLINALDDKIVSSTIKKFLYRQALLYSIKNEDGYTPLDFSVLAMKHYTAQMNKSGGAFVKGKLIDKDNACQELNEVKLNEKTMLLQVAAQEAKKKLNKSKKRGVNALLKCLKQQDINKVLMKIRQYGLDNRELFVEDVSEEHNILSTKEPVRLSKSNRGGGSDSNLQLINSGARITKANRGGGSDTNLQDVDQEPVRLDQSSRDGKFDSLGQPLLLRTSSWRFNRKKPPKSDRKIKK